MRQYSGPRRAGCPLLFDNSWYIKGFDICSFIKDKCIENSEFMRRSLYLTGIKHFWPGWGLLSGVRSHLNLVVTLQRWKLLRKWCCLLVSEIQVVETLQEHWSVQRHHAMQTFYHLAMSLALCVHIWFPFLTLWFFFLWELSSHLI